MTLGRGEREREREKKKMKMKDDEEEAQWLSVNEREEGLFCNTTNNSVTLVSLRGTIIANNASH